MEREEEVFCEVLAKPDDYYFVCVEVARRSTKTDTIMIIHIITYYSYSPVLLRLYLLQPKPLPLH